MNLKSRRTLIFVLYLVATLIIGINLTLNSANQNIAANPHRNPKGKNNNSQPFQIVNVWSHNGSQISKNPPTPPEKDVFLPTENIYVVIKTTGIGQKTVRIYIVKNQEWNKTVQLNDVSGGYEEVDIVATENPQYHGPFLIWKAPLTIGKYDIVVDENLNGMRDPGEKVDDSKVTEGVFVIPELPLGSLMTIAVSLLAIAIHRKLKCLG